MEFQLQNASSVRRSLDVDCLSTGGSGGSSTSSSSAVSVSSSSSTAASLFLARPRAFARQWSDDLRRRRETFAAPGGNHLHHLHHLASPAALSGSPSANHRHSMGMFSLPTPHAMAPPASPFGCRTPAASGAAASGPSAGNNLPLRLHIRRGEDVVCIRSMAVGWKIRRRMIRRSWPVSRGHPGGGRGVAG
jgi:hypothetical protein